MSTDEELTQNQDEDEEDFSDIFDTINYVDDTSIGVPLQPSESKSQEQLSKLKAARVADIIVRISLRIVFAVAFSALLGYQNFQVFSFIARAMELGTLSSLQPIVGLLATTTLAETYGITRIMVEWLFKDIDYNDA